MGRNEIWDNLRQIRPSDTVTVVHLRQWLSMECLRQRELAVDRQAWVLWARYCAPRVRTWREVAVRIGVSQERAQDYAAWGLYCLRHPHVVQEIETSGALVPGSRLWRAIRYPSLAE